MPRILPCAEENEPHDAPGMDQNTGWKSFCSPSLSASKRPMVPGYGGTRISATCTSQR